jgi:hypothetical protein
MLSVHPNPFSSSVALEMGYAGTGTPSEIVIVDVTGRKIRNLRPMCVTGGLNRVIWDGRSDSGVRVSAGVYFCEFRCGDRVEVKRLVLLR